MHSKYRALILDMDGTLLNSYAMVLKSLRILSAEYGIELTDEQRRQGIGCAADDFMAELNLPDPVRASARWREIMENMLDQVLLYDGAQQLLAAPIRRGVVTSQTRDELTLNLNRLRIADAFEHTVTVEETPYQKPHPRPLLYCIEQMGLAPGEVLFVGDSFYDYGCACSAGVDFGLATWGACDPPAAFPEAAYVFDSLPEILTLIEHRHSLIRNTD